MKKMSVKNTIVIVLFFFLKGLEKVLGIVKNHYYLFMQKNYLVHKKVEYSRILINGLTKWSIHDSASVEIGEGAIINSGVDNGIGNESYSKVEVGPHAKLVIGGEFGMSNTVIQCRSSITIGERVRIGNGCLIMDTDFHNLDWRKRTYYDKHDDEPVKSAPIIIGDNVFIGTRCVITKGVVIGKHSVIAAGSVVVSNVPEDEIWGGNPAKFIKKI